MTRDRDTLLTALYVEIDDHVAPPRQGRGRRPRLTDAELVCLAVARVLLGFDCEHRWNPVRLLPAGPPVPLPAQPARLPRAAAGRRATAGPGDQPPGPGQPVVVRQPAADRRHAAAVWSLAGDGQPLGHRRNRRIRVLCLPHPLLLGPQALSGHRARRNAHHLVLGGPEAPASGRSAWTC